MIRTQIQLTGKQMRLLKAMTADRGESLAMVIRQAVDAFTRQTAGEDLEERRRRAVAAAGRFHSGVRDLSERHDDYFAEAVEE